VSWIGREDRGDNEIVGSSQRVNVMTAAGDVKINNA
jgi:hypothetical protein